MPSPVPNGAEDRWQNRALCKGMNPEIFVPTSDDEKYAAAAKAVCKICIVQDECLEFALEDKRLEGIWGGTTDRERRKIRRQRLIASAKEALTRREKMD